MSKQKGGSEKNKRNRLKNMWQMRQRGEDGWTGKSRKVGWEWDKIQR